MTQQSELTQSAIGAGKLAMHHLEQTVASLQKGIAISKGEYWYLPSFMQWVKFYFIFQARSRSVQARASTEEFQVALGKLELAHEAEVKLHVKSWTFIHDVLGTGFGELFMTGSLTKNRISINIALSRVRRVVRALEAPGEAPVPNPA